MIGRLLLIVAACVGAATGCADRLAGADSIAAPAGLARMTFKTDGFTLAGWGRIAAPDQPAAVYIEGDGLAWLSRNEPSPDPTPRRPLALVLAAADPSPNVVYLARPCQFTPQTENPSCGVPYWTGRRFSPEVLAALDQAADQIAGRVPGQGLHLIGYSGGGAVAALLAARRRDVLSLRTVAGNLDHDAVNRRHGVTPLRGSLNAIDVAAQIGRVPQIHFSGGRDKVVPPQIAEAFKAAARSPCAAVRVLPDADHENGWAAAWPRLLTDAPACQGLYPGGDMGYKLAP